MSIPTPEKRVADFENLGFGMFIHWGLYSQLGKGEWIQSVRGIPKEEYTKLQGTFTASEFDARHIVSVAKAAGAKYITLAILLVYCLKDVDFLHRPFGLPQLVALAFTVTTYLWKGNSMVSIFGGTIIFMILRNL